MNIWLFKKPEPKEVVCLEWGGDMSIMRPVLRDADGKPYVRTLGDSWEWLDETKRRVRWIKRKAPETAHVKAAVATRIDEFTGE